MSRERSTGNGHPWPSRVRWPRALAAWLMIALAETAHGILRQLFLVPLVGDLPARQIGVPVGCAIIFAIAWAATRWIGARTLAGQLQVGLVWVALIVAFEIGLGLALGYGRERLLSDYDLAAGGFMGIGLLFTLFSPILAARLRRFR